MSYSSLTISEMPPEIHTVEKFDYLKHVIHSKIIKFSVFSVRSSSGSRLFW